MTSKTSKLFILFLIFIGQPSFIWSSNEKSNYIGQNNIFFELKKFNNGFKFIYGYQSLVSTSKRFVSYSIAVRNPEKKTFVLDLSNFVLVTDKNKYIYNNSKVIIKKKKKDFNFRWVIPDNETIEYFQLPNGLVFFTKGYRKK